VPSSVPAGSGIGASRLVYSINDLINNDLRRIRKRDDPEGRLEEVRLSRTSLRLSSPRTPFLDSFRVANYTGVGPDFVQMRPWGGV
jgi:hypothetical protein